MNIARYSPLPFVLLALFAWHLWGAQAAAESGPQLKADANILNCTACHGDVAVRPKEHCEVKNGSDCVACHKIGREYKPDKHTSLRGKLSLMHLHGLNEVGCEDCHASLTEPEPVTTEGCLGCHDSFESVVKKTEFLGHFNPHISKHYGAKQDCNICHFIHEKSDNLCCGCHDVYRPIP